MTGGSALAPELADALLHDDYFVERNASSVEVVWSSRRPVSNVYQVRVQLEPESNLFWIKTHSPESLGEAEREYRFLREAGSAFVDFDHLGVPKAVTYLPEVDAIVSEHVGGVSLTALIKRSLNWFAAPFADLGDIVRHLERCGSWLAVLHSTALPASEAYDREVLREYVDVRLKTLADEASIDAAFRGRVMTYLEALLSDFDPEALLRVRTHGDYAPYNILVCDDRLIALDPGVGSHLARLEQHSCRYDDLVHCFGFTRMMSTLLIRSGIREQLAAAFLRGYTAGGGPPVSEESAGFRAFSLKHELLEVTGMPWPSLLGRLTSRRLRLARFRRWFERARRP